jgi:2'-5' RNA ligase
MRLFIGIALPEAVLAELAAVCARLRPKAEGLRWTAPESWHITLQFLGNTSPEQLECLAVHLADVRSAAFSVHLGRLGCFDRAGIFYAAVDPAPPLAALQQRVTAATARCGFQAENRPFHPHITLARSKGPARSNGTNRSRSLNELLAHMQPQFSRFTAAEFLLYESRLLPEGARYEVRVRFPLAITR